jgi:hypothetical protein
MREGFYYRWNPFLNHWEFWDSYKWNESHSFYDSGIDLDLSILKELSYEDTWCEPTRDILYEIGDSPQL